MPTTPLSSRATASITTRDIDRGDSPHYLLKEISEAPSSFRKTLRGKLVDRDGELKVVLLNTDRSEPFVVEPGMRIAQLVVVPVAFPEPREVAELPDSERGEKGFGSSAH